MAGGSAFGLIQLRVSTRVPQNIFFLWLDEHSTDFEKFKERFCAKTSVTSRQWKFCSNKDECYHFIKQAEPKQNIVLISAGRLSENIIGDLHDLSQLHSIYIYCNKKGKYETWKNDYTKVRGVFNDPLQLFDQMCENLNEEAHRTQTNIFDTNNTTTLPRNVPVKVNCIFRHELKSYIQPNISWCPWTTNKCTVSLPARGRGTIEICQQQPVPFELHISNKPILDDNDTNSYAIVLRVDDHEAQLGTINSQNEPVLRVSDSTEQPHQVLQLEKGYWHCYWLTFCHESLIVQYGMGEIRPKFKILEVHLRKQDKTSIEGISYLHIKINNSTDITDTKDLKDKLKIFIGGEPIVFDPPLLIITPTDFSPTHPADNTGVVSQFLENPFQDLYHEVKNFILEDQNFPNFIETIERSIQNPNGWCHQKLAENANQFGRPRDGATYLRITVDELEDRILKHQCVLEIWPRGCYSPVHNHGNAYGILRVLHGKLLVKLFPALSLNLCQSLLIEQIFEKDQVTWMVPNLNQTHQMKNPDMYGPCCITIQCYYNEAAVQKHCEFFDFITNDGRHIEHFHGSSDNNYLAFKNAMKEESTDRTSV